MGSALALSNQHQVRVQRDPQGGWQQHGVGSTMTTCSLLSQVTRTGGAAPPRAAQECNSVTALEQGALAVLNQL